MPFVRPQCQGRAKRRCASSHKGVMSASTRAVIAMCVLIGAVAGRAQAQTVSTQVLPEDLQPRIIGTEGTTTIGIAGYVDRFFSSERLFQTNYTAQIDVDRFVARKFVVRGGLAGSGRFGGEDADELPTGSGAPAL